MSSSDDDWLATKKPHPATGAVSGRDAMLEARRRALQQHRNPPPSQTDVGPSVITTSHSVPKAGRLGEPVYARSAAASAGSGTIPIPTATPDVIHTVGIPSQPTLYPVVTDSTPHTEDNLEILRREVEARRKLLLSTREKEAALHEQWRAKKANLKATIHQLDNKLRSLRGALEDDQGAAATKVQEAHARQEQALREAQREVEKRVKEMYEPQIDALKEKTKSLQQEEERLKALLSVGDETKQIVDNAIASALSTVISRVQQVFSENAGDTVEWRERMKELVRHEVRSSFAVSMDSEGQSEREEYQRHFDELLDFWRHAEQEVQEHIAKMDDALLEDLRCMAREDLSRLQHEVLTMEEVYAESRQSWARQHQEWLQKELEAATTRRQQELDDQRALRDQIHAERLADIEQRHRERMESLEKLHHQEMEQLRQQFASMEQLHEERHRVQLSTQEDVSKATESLLTVVASMEELVTSLKGYQCAVDEGRTAVETARRSALQEQEETLRKLQDMLAAQRVSVDGERRSLSDVLSRLQLVSQTVQQHLQDEATWLAQQVSRYQKSKEEWSRQYRRWKHLVQTEKQRAEERFAEAFSALHEGTNLLESERRSLAVEADAMKRTFDDITRQEAKEVGTLQRRGEEIQQRHQAMQEMMNVLTQRSTEVTTQWQVLQEERCRLTSERDQLREDESKLQQMLQLLKFTKCIRDGAKMQTLTEASRGLALQQQLHQYQQERMQHTSAALPQNIARRGTESTALAVQDPNSPTASPKNRLPSSTRMTARLPQRVLRELQDQLRSLQLSSFQAMASANIRHPNDVESTTLPTAHNVATLPKNEGATQSGRLLPANSATTVPRSQKPITKSNRATISPQKRAHSHKTSPNKRKEEHTHAPRRTLSSPTIEHAVHTSPHGDSSIAGTTFTNLITLPDAESSASSPM